MRTVLLLLTAVVVLAVIHAATSAAAPSAATTERYLARESWHAFADVGRKDNGGPDDIYAAQQQLETKDGHEIGLVNGYGVNLHPPYVFFHWTAKLRDGTLTLESAVDLHSSTTVFPIEGGTGRYAGVRGTVTLSDQGSRGTLVTVRYRR